MRRQVSRRRIGIIEIGDVKNRILATLAMTFQFLLALDSVMERLRRALGTLGSLGLLFWRG